MKCKHELRWVQKGEKGEEFAAFKLDMEKQVQKRLESALKHIPTDEHSEKTLRIRIKNKKARDSESYEMRIAKHTVEIQADNLKGAYFGIKALKLLLGFGGHVLTYGTIREEPDFANRAVMLDVSRGKMPEIEYLKHLVCVLSDLGYNILQIYCEDKLFLPKHPNLGKLTGAYTEAEIRELDRHCCRHFMELQPCIQTYSHMHGVLRTPGYEMLSENQDLFSLAAGKEEVYEFLEEELAEVLPWFSSKTVNITMDEAYDLGTGHSRESVQKKGKTAVFAEHIKRVIEIAERQGAEKVMMWGDGVVKYPELQEQLPDDVILIDWNYNPQSEYPSLNAFHEGRHEFWAAAGVSTWNSIFPRVYNMYQNIIVYSSQAKEMGAEGFMLTDWGDYGHCQPLGLSLYGYLLGGCQAFHAERIDAKLFEKKMWPAIFQDKRLRRAFRLLMDSNLSPGLQTGFKTMTIYYFFDDMMDGLSMHGNSRYPYIPEESFHTLAEQGEKACQLLDELLDEKIWESTKYIDQSWKELFGEKFLYELKLSAWMTWFTGKKGMLAYEIKKNLRKKEVRPEIILRQIWDIRCLYAKWLEIRDFFQEVWLLRSKRSGIESSLSLFDGAGMQLKKTAEWLALQREAVLEGKTADGELETYLAGKDYGILWTGDFKNMWDRAYPWQ